MIKFKKIQQEEIISKIPFLINKYKQIGYSNKPEAGKNWIMGELRNTAIGNINLTELHKLIDLNKN